MRDGFDFFFKIWRPCQKDLGQIGNRTLCYNRSCHRSSSLSIDHAHEQMNKKIKGVWGSHWSPENSQMIERWMVAGQELSRVVKEFEGVQNELDELPHHRVGRASQRRFLCHVRDYIDVILMNGDPFEDQLRGLVSLGDKVCESPPSAHSVYFIESTGKEQFYTQGK